MLGGELNTIPVLDHGYVRLVDALGDDLSVVNAARVSFDKESTVLSEKDKPLIEYLIKNNHTSPLRHCAVTLEVYAPLMVARQWQKHMVSSSYIDDQNGWNETSRRYVTEQEEFYIPSPGEWRGAPQNAKQGSLGFVDPSLGAEYTQALVRFSKAALELYEQALADGIAPEQARLLLPAYAMYVRWRWTASLNAVLNFLSLRLDSHAQAEIQQYAQAVELIIGGIWPLTADAWMRYRV